MLIDGVFGCRGVVKVCSLGRNNDWFSGAFSERTCGGRQEDSKRTPEWVKCLDNHVSRRPGNLGALSAIIQNSGLVSSVLALASCIFPSEGCLTRSSSVNSKEPETCSLDFDIN
jgi:hypothetical protein